MGKKFFRNKRGATLPFVLIISLALLILAAAPLMLVSTGGLGLKNMENEAQGYLNARSAMSFAQSVLKSDAASTVQSFYLTATSSGGALTFTRVNGTPSDMTDVYATCTYNATTNAINVYGYVKTASYSTSKTLHYSATYHPPVDVSDELIANTSTVNKSSDYIKITKSVTIAKNETVILTAQMVQLGITGTTITLAVNKASTFVLNSSSGSTVPVLINGTVKITGDNNYTLNSGYYYLFQSGNAIDGKKVWSVKQAGDGSDILALNSFTGGVYQ